MSMDVLVTGFDIRLPPNVNMPKFEEQLSAWCRDAGPGVTYEHFHAVRCYHPRFTLT